MNLIIILLAIIQTGDLVAAGLSFMRYSGTDLRAFCDGKDIDLTTWFELESLVEQLNSFNTYKCDDYYKQALNELLNLYRDDKDYICTTRKAWEIGNYYRTYLEQAHAPDSLRRFVAAYGLQVSGHCKLNMISIFLNEGKELLTREDFKELEDWTAKTGPIASLLDAMAAPGAMVWPIDLFTVLPDDIMMNKLSLQTRQSGKIQRAKKICSKRFQPIYRPAAGPVIALMREGFDYADILKHNDEKSKKYITSELNEWAKIIFLCETLDSVEVFPGSDGKESTRLLTEEEVEALRKNGIEDDDEDLLSGERPIERVVYETENRVFVDNVLVPPDQSVLDVKTAIRAQQFETTSDKLKHRLLKQSWRLMKTRLRHGEYKRLFKLAMKQIELKWKSRDRDMTKERLETVNQELIDSLEAKEDTLAYKILRPVFKLLKRMFPYLIGFSFILLMTAL